MATFVQWLKEQEGREQDPVGWFAQFWRDLPDKPRLSAVHSVTRHLEERDLFRLTPGLTEAHDAALAEYRHQREGVVRPVPDPEPGQGPAGQAVARAAQAGLEAAQAYREVQAAQPPAGYQAVTGAEPVRGTSQLDRIEAKLDAIMVTLGLAEPWEPDWQAMFEQADLSAVPDE